MHVEKIVYTAVQQVLSAKTLKNTSNYCVNKLYRGDNKHNVLI